MRRIILAVSVLALAASGSSARGVDGMQQHNSANEAGAVHVFERGAQAAGAAGVPRFEYDPTWPKLPLPNEWIMGEVGGIGASADGHVWVIQRPWTVIDR